MTAIKRSLALACALLLALAAGGCGARLQRYEATYLSLFDTVTTIVLYAPSEALAQEEFAAVYAALEEDYRLFDIYHEYAGLNNLKTVNDNAGIAPVAVDARLLDLLAFGKDVHALTGGRVNIAYGSVLSLWHDARTAAASDPASAALPEAAALEAAAAHANIEGLVLDEAAGTAYLSDPLLRLDVGAIGKGFAAQRAVDEARARGVEHMLLNLGGNVCALGMRADGEPWRVNVQDPDDASASLGTVGLADASLVTSGGYQRYFTVGGTAYHHIIDPQTHMPAQYVKAVTVTHADSALADAFSTALFNMPYEQGRALAEANGVRAVWELLDGSIERLDLPWA